MARRSEQDNDTTQTAPAQPDPAMQAELERLRAENAQLRAAAPAPAPAEGAPGPQGIVVRRMSSGDEKKDFHPRWRQQRMIDPKSLVVDGKPPAIALPIDGDPARIRVRRIEPSHAAYILTCDPASGGQSIYRLATDEEVEAYEKELEARRGPALRSREKDIRNQK